MSGVTEQIPEGHRAANFKIGKGSNAELATVQWMPYRLFPYERGLGIRELEALGAQVIDCADELTIIGDISEIAARATYFQSLEVISSKVVVPSAQSMTETRHRELRNETSKRRQATRFGVHGVHEYKGRFNPQVVRSLCNIIDPEADVLIDPFCGSGTALVEGLRLGLNVLGVDRSAMAALIARAKIDILLARDKRAISARLAEIADDVASEIDRGQKDSVPADLSRQLGKEAVTYLQGWFSGPAYCGVSRGLSRLNSESRSYGARLAQLALSSILRQVSNQLPEDLRIRRRPEPFVAPLIAPLFLDAVAGFQRGLEEMEGWCLDPLEARVIKGLAEDVGIWDSESAHGRRLLLTSPPYATALPYIDTDRLSIVSLGLAESSELGTLERSLLGSREWTRSEQTDWDDRRGRNDAQLPTAVTSLLRRIDGLNTEAGAGFRRRAVPSLLYRYFAEMGKVLDSWRRALNPGEAAVLIVGHNSTTAGGERIDVATPSLLGEVAESRGFDVSELLNLETWPRYGLHAANAVSGEDALVLRVPA
jgi:hypothetical protein